VIIKKQHFDFDIKETKTNAPVFNVDIILKGKADFVDDVSDKILKFIKNPPEFDFANDSVNIICDYFYSRFLAGTEKRLEWNIYVFYRIITSPQSFKKPAILSCELKSNHNKKESL